MFLSLGNGAFTKRNLNISYLSYYFIISEVPLYLQIALKDKAFETSNITLLQRYNYMHKEIFAYLIHAIVRSY